MRPWNDMVSKLPWERGKERGSVPASASGKEVVIASGKNKALSREKKREGRLFPGARRKNRLKKGGKVRGKNKHFGAKECSSAEKRPAGEKEGKKKRERHPAGKAFALRHPSRGLHFEEKGGKGVFELLLARQGRDSGKRILKKRWSFHILEDRNHLPEG